MSDISIVTAKVDTNLKRAAQKKARELGVPISAVIKEALRDFVNKKRFSLEEPSQYLLDMIEESRRDYERGDYISFPASQAAGGLRDALKNLED
ncbi:ribbon-helix-helix protein, CopG family [Candidatus Saccharibacteria bacterium]|nr:ribbon-helix-helix protein, CopG family [Candidatus Saccharibacteria bacterium]